MRVTHLRVCASGRALQVGACVRAHSLARESLVALRASIGVGVGFGFGFGVGSSRASRASRARAREPEFATGIALSRRPAERASERTHAQAERTNSDALGDARRQTNAQAACDWRLVCARSQRQCSRVQFSRVQFSAVQRNGHNNALIRSLGLSCRLQSAGCKLESKV